MEREIAKKNLPLSTRNHFTFPHTYEAFILLIEIEILFQQYEKPKNYSLLNKNNRDPIIL